MGLAVPGTIAAAVEEAAARLRAAGVDNPGGDARLLMARALGVVPTWVFGHALDPLPDEPKERFGELVGRREARVPLQHLLGEQEFFSLTFAVGPEVLVPRPETELLVEATLDALAGIERPRVADVGTGSGCVAVALASQLGLGRIVAVDRSPAALEFARRNAAEHGFAERIAFHEGDLLEPLRGGEPLHAIAANLPYLSEAEWEDCEPEVREHDPREALVAGPEGLELIARLVEEAPPVLAKGGWLGLEVGWTQAERVAGLLRDGGWRDLRVRPDFAGIDRVVEARRPA